MYKNLMVLVESLKSRRTMYLLDNSYNTLFCYIMGYFEGLYDRDSDTIHMTHEFREWLMKKEKKHFSIHWSIYILNEIANKDEEKSCQILFELLHEFAQERLNSTPD